MTNTNELDLNSNKGAAAEFTENRQTPAQAITEALWPSPESPDLGTQRQERVEIVLLQRQLIQLTLQGCTIDGHIVAGDMVRGVNYSATARIEQQGVLQINGYNALAVSDGTMRLPRLEVLFPNLGPIPTRGADLALKLKTLHSSVAIIRGLALSLGRDPNVLAFAPEAPIIDHLPLVKSILTQLAVDTFSFISSRSEQTAQYPELIEALKNLQGLMTAQSFDLSKAKQIIDVLINNSNVIEKLNLCNPNKLVVAADFLDRAMTQEPCLTQIEVEAILLQEFLTTTKERSSDPSNLTYYKTVSEVLNAVAAEKISKESLQKQADAIGLVLLGYGGINQDNVLRAISDLIAPQKSPSTNGQ